MEESFANKNILDLNSGNIENEDKKNDREGAESCARITRDGSPTYFHPPPPDLTQLSSASGNQEQPHVLASSPQSHQLLPAEQKLLIQQAQLQLLQQNSSETKPQSLTSQQAALSQLLLQAAQMQQHQLTPSQQTALLQLQLLSQISQNPSPSTSQQLQLLSQISQNPAPSTSQQFPTPFSQNFPPQFHLDQPSTSSQMHQHPLNSGQQQPCEIDSDASSSEDNENRDFSQFNRTQNPNIESRFRMDLATGLNQAKGHSMIAREADGTVGGFATIAQNMGKLRKKRSVYTAQQVEALENQFSKCQNITQPEIRLLCALYGLTEFQVKKWFQNRRTKEKKLQQSLSDPPEEK